MMCSLNPECLLPLSNHFPLFYPTHPELYPPRLPPKNSQHLRNPHPLPILQPNIPSLALNPLLPRNLIRLLEIPHPALSIEQRTRPSSLVQHVAQLAQAAGRAVAVVLALQAEPDRFLLVVLVVRRDQILRSLHALRVFRQRALEYRRSHAAAHLVLVPREGEDGCPGPEDVGGGCVRVAFGGIEEEIADARAGDVLVFLRDVGENDAVRNVCACPHVCRLFEVCFTEIREAEEPEDGAGDAFEDA
jgi:hypothetical protein